MLDTLQTFVSTVSETTNSWLSLNQKVWESDRKDSQVVGPIPDSLLPQYTLADVSEHWMPDDCWVVVCDRVYDITEFLDEHPGGQYIIMEHAGRDATLVFRGSRHSQEAYDMLDKYLVGVLVEHERLYLTTHTNYLKGSL